MWDLFEQEKSGQVGSGNGWECNMEDDGRVVQALSSACSVRACATQISLKILILFPFPPSFLGFAPLATCFGSAMGSRRQEKKVLFQIGRIEIAAAFSKRALESPHPNKHEGLRRSGCGICSICQNCPWVDNLGPLNLAWRVWCLQLPRASVPSRLTLTFQNTKAVVVVGFKRIDGVLTVGGTRRDS